MRLAKVQYVSLEQYHRVIVMSDIHGDVESFQGVLERVGFSKEDALVIVGDILEKGAHSLELLRTVMEYCQQGNVYMVAGNNDTIFEGWYEDLVTMEDVLWYMNKCQHSIFIDMAKELNLGYRTEEEITMLKEEIRNYYGKELTFLSNLPDIIDTEIATFVHAGLKPGALEEQDQDYCQSALEFGIQPHRFEKLVVVGHWPASNYRDTIINANVYHNRETNVISIDGGNSMKRWQQLNYLIFQDGMMQSGCYERQPVIRALDAQEGSENPITLIFPKTQIEIKERYEVESLCYVPYLQQEMLMKNANLYEYKRKNYCSDFTTYDVPVEKGELLRVCKEEEDHVIVKKANGDVGKYFGRYEVWEG